VTVQIYSSLVRVCSTEPAASERFRPWSELTERTHLHGLLVFRIDGRRVPSMGYFGPDDVCLDTWLPVLLDAQTALLRDGGTHVFEEYEQGQPAFHFARRGESLVFTVGPSLLGGGKGSPEWDGVACSHASFDAAVSAFAARFRRDLHANAPGAADAWWADRVGARSVSDAPPARPVLVIDGSRFDDFAGFVAEAAEQLLPTSNWHGSLDAFNDMLRGGFGAPESGFVLEWREASRSRRQLGHTLFDDLVSVLRDHGEGGPESEDAIELRLFE
jgi:hypothetical protein